MKKAVTVLTSFFSAPDFYEETVSKFYNNSVISLTVGSYLDTLWWHLFSVKHLKSYVSLLWSY
jgi:hypothetical protein